MMYSISMKRIPVRANRKVKRYAYVDDIDYKKISAHKWRFQVGGYARTGSATTKQTPISMHRLVMDAPKGVEVDHIDGNPLNNQRGNLRLCNRNENKANTRIIKTNTTGYKGVSKHKGRWQASIRVHNILIYLGRYDTKHEAAHTYNVVAEQIFGDFAWLNPIRKRI